MISSAGACPHEPDPPPGDPIALPRVVVPAGVPGPDGRVRPYPVYGDTYDLLFGGPTGTLPLPPRPARPAPPPRPARRAQLDDDQVAQLADLRDAEHRMEQKLGE